MKRRITAAAVICASLLLTGCGTDYGTDISKEYKDYLDYTFDKDYTLVVAEEGVINEDTEAEQGYRYWDVTFTDKNGREITDRISTSEFMKSDREYYKNKKTKSDMEMFAFSTFNMGKIAKNEMYDKVVSNYFPCDWDYNDESSFCDGGDYNLMLMEYCPISGFDNDGTEMKIINKKLSGTEGFKICDADMVNVSNDDLFMTFIIVTLEEEADTDKYLEKFKKMESELCETLGDPQNMTFMLKQKKTVDDSTKRETIYADYYLMGEKYDFDSEKQKDDNVANSFGSVVLEKIRANYR